MTMSDLEFKVGDIVELKSGGPPMTVAEVNINLVGYCEIKCRWWFGQMEEASFTPKLLKPGQPRAFEELKPVGGGPPKPSTPPAAPGAS